jgi:alginate O-acetyltransferase complex protein AlgI
MLSTDPLFYFCTAVIFVLFYAARSPLLQTLVLAVGSFAMYATEGWRFLALLAVSSVLTSVCSFLAAGCRPHLARTAMLAGVAVNLSVLAAFKYKQLLVPLHTQPSVTWVQDFLGFSLPIGISFYTFHGISLVVDAWRNPEVLRHRGSFLRHCLDTGLYLAFFPQLVAGPITKGKMFFPQIVAKRLADVPWAEAARDIIIGTFLKRVIADNLNQMTTPLTDARTYSGSPQAELIAMVIGYSAQIFADFAGYSLIAIGVAKLFGYRLPDNFNRPYIAQSITDFWRRWHMSLSAWLKEYLYISLGGNRHGPLRTYINLLLVMGLGGLWHGADWKFAIWGLWHGALLAIERALGLGEPSTNPLLAMLRVPIIFVLVTFGWLFFRLTNLGDIVLLYDEFAKPWRDVESTGFGNANVTTIYLLSAVVLLFHIPLDYLRSQSWFAAVYKSAAIPLRPYALGFLLAAIFMASGSRHAFIYFQF